MVLSFGWKNVIVIFEDTDNGRDMATFMTNFFQEKSIAITYMSPVSTSARNEVLLEELQKLSYLQTKVYIMHASHSIASHIFQNAKYLGMMDAGYKWIVTSKTMNLLNFTDDEVIESMQGVVGFKTYITLRSKKDINVYAISAYDGVSALAMAIEKMQSVLKLNTKDLATNGSAQWGYNTSESDVKNLI
ncbi:hypothetical protein L1987_64019 [Smallanthus sonchifolius]|uniref:Uncharacterized protein n=1 Tax=Smallanthus sonchifolius TaxID=185202 RepID=A0ACB9CEY7_9ASTR|nr:hypothetical protein L1987_64019 [Smallanthus sonchifolius]